MSYLAQLKKGKRKYYYLVEHIRIAKGRRKELRMYVGTEKPSEKKLKVLLPKFEKEVKKEKIKLHGFHYLTSDEIDEINQINKEFWKRYKEQNNVVQEQFDKNFVMAFVFNTNSIEGSTLTPKEVELLLSEDIAPNRPLKDILEAKSGEKALECVKEYKGRLNQTFLLKLHEIYFRDSYPQIAGAYKTMENRVEGSTFETTPPELVPADMKSYFKEYLAVKKKLHPLELAAWAHWKLVRIHPFQDGNGRVARLVMNFVLHKNGYPMIDIKTKDKKTYFGALEKCHYNKNARALAMRLVVRFRKQYQNALKRSGN